MRPPRRVRPAGSTIPSRSRSAGRDGARTPASRAARAAPPPGCDRGTTGSAPSRRANDPERRASGRLAFEARDREVLLVDPRLPDKEVLVAAFGRERDDVAVAAALRVGADQLHVVVGGGDGAVGLVLPRGRLLLGVHQALED